MSYVETAGKYFDEDKNHSMIVGGNNKSMINEPTNNAVFMSQVKAESKDHKWKEAPIMGMEERRNVEEQR